MIDPWLGLFALALQLAEKPAVAPGDPGPSDACPSDMRLVEGMHYDSVAHVCLDPPQPGVRPDQEGKRHCYHYAEDFTLLEGPVTPIRVCMDQFEAPNRRGADPMVMESYRSGSRWCEKRGKRMCSEQEWELACEGPEHRPESYGWSVNVRLCNSNKPWRPVDFPKFDGPRDIALKESNKLWQGVPSGHYASCVSPFGIFDLNGNVEEWVTSRAGRKWPGALMGGFWAKAWTGCRGTNDAHQPTFAFYETGFRCCKEPKAIAGRTQATQGTERTRRADYAALAEILIEPAPHVTAFGDRFGLGPAERRVLSLLASGLSNQAIAARLGISPATVRTHAYNLFRKLGVGSRVEALVRLRDDRGWFERKLRVSSY